jgi:hypothetical protein
MARPTAEELAREMLRVITGVYGIRAGQPFAVQSLMIQFDQRRAELYRALQYAGGQGWITATFTLTERGYAAASDAGDNG